MESLANISWLIPILPLLGAIVAGFFGKKLLKGQSHWPIWLSVGGSAVTSLLILFAMIGATGEAGMQGDGHAAAGLPAEYVAAEAGKETKVEKANPVAFQEIWYTWFTAGDEADKGGSVAGTGEVGFFEISAGALFDPLSAIMLSVVCGIGFLITVFAAGYMKGEAGYYRFFAYLGLFICSMTLLVMGNNLILLYLGWEGVGLCSYLLIGYYFDKPAAREAAKKAFLVNRVGDFGFAIGIMLIFYCFGTVQYFPTYAEDGSLLTAGFIDMFVNPAAHVAADKLWLVDLIPFCLMVGAFGKSAQFPLYVWLPDAMEGPTPVSALIHAATMVTAGIYMIARLGPVFSGSPAALYTITAVGAFTCLFAATIALRQFDLKKVFAYSTVSQLGYMFVGVGVLAPVAGVFHLATHAFFKALLFLGSGVVMHAMLGHLDMRKMSGLKHQLPKTRILILIGCLALAGFPLTAGYFSKDEIIHYASYAGDGWPKTVLWLVLSLTAFMTAYYTFRLYFRVFEGPEQVSSEPHPDHHGDDHGHDDHGHGHDDHAHHNHEPWIMIAPLVLLAVGALFAGFVNLPGVHTLGNFLGHSPSFLAGYEKAAVAFPGVDPHGFGQHGEYKFKLLPFLIAGAISVAGIGLAWFLHLNERGAADNLAGKLRGFTVVLDGKYWVDQVYQGVIVEPLRVLGKVLGGVDKYVVGGLVWLIAFLPQIPAYLMKVTTQQGYLQRYAYAMLVGVAVILLAVFVF
ncbi:MAG: NADH-quinone oxidoreductase subunit L [Planctomycetota bacterium]